MQINYFLSFSLLFFSTVFSSSVMGEVKYPSKDIQYQINRSDQTELGRQLWSLVEKKCSQKSTHKLEGFKKDWFSHEETFTYYYNRNNQGKTKTVVIYLPGGPGGMGSFQNMPNLKDIDNIKIDPRGLGCNYMLPANLKDQYLTTKQTARDILELIKRLKLDSYVIYGSSYGTVLGTVLTSMIEKDSEVINPKSVVFEGTLGKLIGTHDSYTQSYSNIWNKIVIKNPFIKNIFNSPLPYPSLKNNWGSIIENGLENDSSELVSFFKLVHRAQNGIISEEDEKALDSEIKKRLDDVIVGPFSAEIAEFAGADRVLRTLVCKELSRDWRYHSFKTIGSVLIAKPKPLWPAGDLCSKNWKLKAYDSINHQILTPIYYFQGSTDPQTPESSAIYHFIHQKKSLNKFYQNVANHGHRPLRRRLLPCANEIWEQVFQNASNLEEVISKNGHCLRSLNRN